MIDLGRLQALLKHIDACPFGWHDGHVIASRHRSESSVIEWLKRLHELREGVGKPLVLRSSKDEWEKSE